MSTLANVILVAFMLAAGTLGVWMIVHYRTASPVVEDVVNGQDETWGKEP